MGDGLDEVGPVCTGSALTQVVVVTTTTPPPASVEVKVDVIGLSVGVVEEPGLFVVGLEVTSGWSVYLFGLWR